MNAQLFLPGDEALMPPSERKAQAAKAKAQKVLVQRLRVAADALDDYMAACRRTQQGDMVHARGAADGRVILHRDMLELASWLDRAGA